MDELETAAGMAAAVASGEVSPVELVQRSLSRVQLWQEPTNAFTQLLFGAGLEEAHRIEAQVVAGEAVGPLAGVPIAVKDLFDLAGSDTTGCSLAYVGNRAVADAPVVRRLKAAGAIVVGKTNMHELAAGATNLISACGPTANPWDLSRITGGSSGGSGAAVAAGLCAAALGTDTGGSVRIPASYCGVVGFKPSFGLVSTRGVVPLSWRLDHVGPLTRTVEDARILFEALRGFDPACPDSRRSHAGDPVAAPIDGLRLGVLRNFNDEPVEPAVAAAFADALRVFERLGGKIREIALSSYDSVGARRAALLRIEADAALIHADLYEQQPERFSPAIRGYLDYGARASAVQLARAERLIDIAAAELERAFDELDAILSPATPQPAFAFGADPPDNQNAFCLLANFAGAPAISLPMGKTEDGLPLGLQIMSAADCDGLALRLAEAYEKAAG